MIAVLVGLLLLSWVLGRTEGLFGGLVGTFIGALVMTGMASTARSAELADLYSPAHLASTAAPVFLVAAVLALVVPYVAAFASLGWGAGALFGLVGAAQTGQAVYVLPFTVHALAAAAVVGLARRRAAALRR